MKLVSAASIFWIAGLSSAGLCVTAACAGSDTTTAATPATTSAGEGGAGGSVNFGLGGSGGDSASCGNNTCEKSGGEDCETCPLDCGDCPTCDLAPTCTGALAVPTTSEPLEECNNDEQTVYACGNGVGVPVEETNCTDPELRFRIRQVNIDRGDLITKGIYCLVSAEDGLHSELLITPIHDAPYGDSTFAYPVSQAIFWGQGDLYTGFSNVTVTYDCYESSNSDTYNQIFSDVADASADVAQNADGYGWVFGTASVAAQILGSTLGSIPDRHILNVQQTIDADALLDLTNGRTWEIRQSGGFVASAYDITLEIQTWGCSTGKPGAD